MRGRYYLGGGKKKKKGQKKCHEIFPRSIVYIKICFYISISVVPLVYIYKYN